MKNTLITPQGKHINLSLEEMRGLLPPSPAFALMISLLDDAEKYSREENGEDATKAILQQLLKEIDSWIQNPTPSPKFSDLAARLSPPKQEGPEASSSPSA